MKPLSSFETSATGYPAKQRDVAEAQNIQCKETRNTNRDAVAEVRSDRRYIWSGGAPLEHFMGNSCKADSNPVATVSTLFSDVIRCMSYLYISTSLEICNASVRLPPLSVACLEFWEPQTPTAQRDCPGLYRDCFSFTSTFTWSARNLVNILDSRKYREVWRNKYSLLAVVFQKRFTNNNIFLHYAKKYLSVWFICTVAISFCRLVLRSCRSLYAIVFTTQLSSFLSLAIFLLAFKMFYFQSIPFKDLHVMQSVVSRHKEFSGWGLWEMRTTLKYEG
jgi:hypothetical protein